MATKNPEIINIHQLLIDQDKLDRISAYFEFLSQMSSIIHSPSNRKEFWSGSFDAIKTTIEILGIEEYLKEKK
jgi:hypothetical protein